MATNPYEIQIEPGTGRLILPVQMRPPDPAPTIHPDFWKPRAPNWRERPVMTGVSEGETRIRDALERERRQRRERGLRVLTEEDPFKAAAMDAAALAEDTDDPVAKALHYGTTGAMAALKAAEQVGMGKTTLYKGAKPGTYAEAPRPGYNLGVRGATAGYVAEKTGKPVAEVLREHGTKGKDLGAAGRRRAAQADAQRTAAKRAKAEFQWQAERVANEDEARGTADPRELLKPDAKSKARMPTENDLKFLQAVTAQIHKAATDPERGQRPVRPEDALKSSPPGDTEAWDYDPTATDPMIAPGVPERWLGAVSHTDMDQTLTRRWLTAARIADAKGQRLRNPVRNLRPEDHKLVEAYVRDLLRNPHVDVPLQLISDLARPGVFSDKAFDGMKRAIMRRSDQGEMVRKGLRMSLSPWGLKAELETAPEKGAEFAKLAEDIMRTYPPDGDVLMEYSPVHEAIAKRASELTPEQRQTLSQHPSKYVRFQIAKQSDLLTQDQVIQMSKDPDLYVAQAAIRSPHATETQVNDVLDRALDIYRRPGATMRMTDTASQVVRSVLMDPRVPADDVIYTLGRQEVRDNAGWLLGVRGKVSFPDMLLRSGRFSPEDKGRVAAHLLNLPHIAGSKENMQWMSGQLGLFLTDTGDAAAGRKQRDPAAVDARSRMMRTMASELDTMANGAGPAEPAVSAFLRMARSDQRFGLAPKADEPGAEIADSDVLRARLADAMKTGDPDAIRALEADLVGSRDLSRKEVRDVTARALWAERGRREQTGGEIRPGDASSKLGWFRDETANALVRPTMQTTSTDTPPVVMWMHPGLGKSTRAAVDGNLIDFDAVRGARLKQMIQGAGYSDYGMPGPNGEKFDKLAWRRAHPGVIERFDSQLLTDVLNDPASRGHIVLTSVLSHLRDRASDMSLVIDMPTDVAVKRIMDRDGKTFEDASAWKRDVDAVMSRFKTDRRYMSTDAYLDDLYAAPEFENLLSRAEVPASIVDTGSLGVNGMFMSGTAGPSEYAFARPSFPLRYAGKHGYGTVAREFMQLPFAELPDGSVTFHQSDAGTGALKWELNSGLGGISGRVPQYRPNVHPRGFGRMTSDRDAALLATVRETDVPLITSTLAKPVHGDAYAPPSQFDRFLYVPPQKISPTGKLSRRAAPRVDLLSALQAGILTGNAALSDATGAGIGAGTPVQSASPLDRYKAMVAFRRLADRLDEAEPYSFPTDFADDLAHRNLPSNEFKTRSLSPDVWNASMRRIVVPPDYAGSPQGRFLQRRYPHIELVPMDPADKAGSFRALSDEAVREFRQAAKAGDADRFAQSRGFLSGDDAPDSLFGIPIAKDRKSWTAEDRRFFAAHPEAGGYYQMEGDAEPDVHGVHGAGRGGDAVSNFLATDEVPETLFGIPVAAGKGSWTGADVRFFREHPEAGGYYDMGDGEGAPGEPPMQAASKAGDTWTWETYRWNPEAKGGRKIDPKNIKGTGVSFDAAKERLRVPKGREAEFEGWMDSLANLPSTIEADGRSVPIKSFLVPKDWRTNTEYNRDYDYVAAFLADAKPGPLDHGPKEGWFWHMGDAGKMPTHPTFSRESYYARDPRYSDLAGDWEGETYLPGKAERAVRQNNNGGNAKKKIPPIVKGPLHYGPPPPPPRGPYPGIANNPGNVEKHERRADKTLFRGEIEGGVRPKRFANFSDPVDGLVAAATVLSRRAAGLAAKGLPFTIENYVPGYAPKSENDTEGYINNLSKYSGFARDAVLDTGNAEDMAKLLKNVVRFESGVPNSEWFTDDEYRRAALAMQEGASSR